MGIQKQQPEDLAIGSYEAAAVMGVHFTKPAQMAQKGHIPVKELAHYGASSGTRIFALYSLAACDDNFAEYDAQYRAGGGKTSRRPRGYVAERAPMLRRLKAEKNKVSYDDAIGVVEAAKILHCHETWVPRLVSGGRIVGRVAHNPRTPASRMLIISRRSCEQEWAKTKKAIADGRKTGRPRSR